MLVRFRDLDLAHAWRDEPASPAWLGTEAQQHDIERLAEPDEELANPHVSAAHALRDREIVHDQHPRPIDRTTRHMLAAPKAGGFDRTANVLGDARPRVILQAPFPAP